MSYTSKSIAFEGAGFRLTSFGKGAAYELFFKHTGKSVFFQGDSAREISNILDALEDIPEGKQAEVLWIALAEYEEVATA